jgi:branched-chain amino acid transport system permease protein
MAAMTKVFKYLPYAAGLAAIFLAPSFVSNNFYVRIMIVAGIYIIVVTGLSLLMGYAGQVSLGHAAFYGLGAYTSGILTTKYQMSVWPAMLVAALLTALVAYAIGVPTLRLKGHYLAVATLGFGEIMNILFGELKGLTGGMDGLRGIPSPSLGGLVLDTYRSYYYLVWIAVVVFLVFALNLAGSRVGRALRAVHGSQVAAEAMGVNTSRYKIQVFILSAVYASAAGSLYAHLNGFVSPENFSVTVSVLLMVMAVVGGMTRVWGAVVGAAGLTLFAEYTRGFEDYSSLVYGLALVLIVIFMPQGIVPWVEETRKRIREWAARLPGKRTGTTAFAGVETGRVKGREPRDVTEEVKSEE